MTTMTIDVSTYEAELRKMLDDEQYAAVVAPHQNVLVRANAGSGKTRVLTARVAYLIAQGIPSEQIMLLTFTKKASREMLERVEGLLNKKEIHVFGGTFHSVAVKILRQYARYIGYHRPFAILDSTDSVGLVAEIRLSYIKRHQLDKTDVPVARIIHGIGSKAINCAISLRDVASEYAISNHEFRYVTEILDEYVERKKLNFMMDFDDLLVNLAKVLEIPDVQQAVSKRYPYLLVDEFQDINHVQAQIIALINEGNNHLFAVGDANQCIYGWRGSRIEYIEQFNQIFPNTKNYYITHNYRSDANILKFAEKAINHNYEGREDKTIISAVHPALNAPSVQQFYSPFGEIDEIVRLIKKKAREGVPYKEMAILVRKNRTATSFERALIQSEIPYVMASGNYFFESKIVKDILCFLRLFANPQDEMAWNRSLQQFNGLGKVTVSKLFDAYRQSGYKLEAMKEAKVGAKAKEGLNKWLTLMMKLEDVGTPDDMMRTIWDDHYSHYLIEKEEDSDNAYFKYDILLEAGANYLSVEDFLDDLVLNDSDGKDPNADVVTISTVHRSKGLEWDYVFLPSLNLGDYSRDDYTIEEEMESRRVFYVAVTRARKDLCLTYNLENPPSPYLEDLDELYPPVDPTTKNAPVSDTLNRIKSLIRNN